MRKKTNTNLGVIPGNVPPSQFGPAQDPNQPRSGFTQHQFTHAIPAPKFARGMAGGSRASSGSNSSGNSGGSDGGGGSGSSGHSGGGSSQLNRTLRQMQQSGNSGGNPSSNNDGGDDDAAQPAEQMDPNSQDADGTCNDPVTLPELEEGLEIL
jgi:hypothetical protein